MNLETELNVLIHNVINSKGSHFDLAILIYNIYKNDYKVHNDKWYKLNDNNQWVEMELAKDLYINISLKIFDLLFEKHQELFNQSRIVETLEESDLYKEKAKILYKIANQCKMVNYKQSLIKECKIIFTVDNLD
tara:strand:- start:923 stop:1324 length:402 start_codon:yes stop_codon:yes gene_type:complete